MLESKSDHEKVQQLFLSDADDVPRAARGTLGSVALPSLLTGARYAAAGTAVGGGTWVALAHWVGRDASSTAVARLALLLSLPYLLALGCGAGVAAAVISAAAATVGAVAGGASRVVAAASRRVLGASAAGAGEGGGVGALTLGAALDRVYTSAVGALEGGAGSAEPAADGSVSSISGSGSIASGGGWTTPGGRIARGVARLAIAAVVTATRSRLAATVPGGLDVPLSPALAARVLASQAAAAAVAPVRSAIVGAAVGVAVVTALGGSMPFLLQLLLRK
ncbi:hypothetical protein MMPV_008835 [Pyropia vietnamensis]